MEIISKTCVNSKWVADFLAREGYDHCQCFGQCKVRVKDDRGYVFILTKDEIRKLKAHERKRKKSA